MNPFNEHIKELRGLVRELRSFSVDSRKKAQELEGVMYEIALALTENLTDAVQFLSELTGEKFHYQQIQRYQKRREEASTADASIKDSMNRLERSLLIYTLYKSKGNIRKAGDMWGYEDARSMYPLLKKHGIDIHTDVPILRSMAELVKLIQLKRKQEV